MSMKKQVVYPYIPNSVPRVKKQKLEEIGAHSVEEFFEDIPEKLKMKRSMNLSEPFLSECSLRRHIEGILLKNKTCLDYLSCLGAGCW